ncbi:Carbohydrate binding family 6 [Catenulispora acidiphila DSM 44928]|uniref:Carbohydrate binding family 6 n=1 Tax=Catenulispora acidiphila (strain DSM 44928 / JCM 14897 / NBRC 102108 / NRRL B-24433 / ID139908) TaxID=479433 RepID=C7Q6P8_CATAD|nr:beta-1,3-glucanase family protein [Catenulispora acidiphila]ACU74083.1 Carbohydrate binding family 6 [Catenulispora acidiphila DSM 44928]
MMNRRKLLSSAVALGGSALGLGTGALAWRASATTPTLQVALQNTTTSNQVYAYVTGQAIDNNNALMLLEADGHTVYYPTSPSSTGSPLAADCAIRLGAPGSTTTITIPHIAGGRIWFAIGAPLTFLLNPGPGLVEPSVSNQSDPNINIRWDFCEFTYNAAQMFANISYVDFVSIPISLALTNGSGATQTVSGLPTNGLDTVCSNLNAQHAADGAGWNQLVVTSGGANLRALSPNNGIVINNSLFSGYYQPYVDQVWSKYSSQALAVDTQASWGTVNGQVSGGTLTFPGLGSFAKPSAADIFSCSTGPFANTAGAMGPLVARISAAFNRSTLLIDATQPDGENPANYYKNAITNHYSRIAHAANLDSRGYGFPYDDVAPNGGADQSGAVSDGNPTLLTVAVGGGTATGPGGGGPSQPSSPSSTGGGGGGTVSAFTTIQAASYSSHNGTQNETTSDTGGGQDVGWIGGGDWLAYANVDFGSAGATQFKARVASGAAAGVSGLIKVALDSPTAAPVGSFAVGNTGGWQTWQTVPANISKVTGKHTVYLVFSSGQPADFVNVHWFTFSQT